MDQNPIPSIESVPAVEYTRVDLYGGALSVELPVGFIDASNFRPVPDHQEVFVSNNNSTSIIIDILESVDIRTEREALDFHFDAIVNQADNPQIWTAQFLISFELPGLVEFSSCQSLMFYSKSESYTPTRSFFPPVYDPPRLTNPSLSDANFGMTLTATTFVDPNILVDHPGPRFTLICLTLLRLPMQGTDLVMTVTIPNNLYIPPFTDTLVLTEDGDSTPVAEEGEAIMRKMYESLQIHDWALFDENAASSSPDS
ncbi:hypothetical protein MMC12_000775 [Toensbergia leucococca]|nr:hypothetical protein [Toensbergia leucococca]